MSTTDETRHTPAEQAPASSLDPKLIDKLRTQATGAQARAEANLTRFTANAEAARAAEQAAREGIDQAKAALATAQRDLRWLDEFTKATAARAAESNGATADPFGTTEVD